MYIDFLQHVLVTFVDWSEQIFCDGRMNGGMDRRDGQNNDLDAELEY